MILFKDTLKIFSPKFIRFLFTGAVNTIFGYGLYGLLVEIQIPYLISLLLATIGGIIFNFFSFSCVVFKSKNNQFLFFKFLISYSFIYGVNAFLLWLLVKYFSFGPLAGQLVCIPVSVILNWFILNKWVYKKV
jgi:putative flippase GtrA